MEKKDDRHKDKRRKMKVYQNRKYTNAPTANTKTGTNTTSSSSQEAKNKHIAVVDVVDSSDEQKTWRGKGGGSLAAQHNLALLQNTCDDEEDAQENPQISAANFELLAQQPLTTGGHFKFSTEKDWETADSSNVLLDKFGTTGKYFTLNRKLINAGLQTIPFYKRMDYASTLFTSKQIEQMERSADLAEQKYQTVLREHQENDNASVKHRSQENSAGSGGKKTTKTNMASFTAEKGDATANNELDELLNLTNTEITKMNINSPAGLTAAAAVAPIFVAESTATAKASKSGDDIQDWLDSVLDE